MCIGDRKGSLGAVCFGWKVLRDRNDTTLYFRDERYHVTGRKRMRDILDNVVDARLSKEAEISALRRKVAVELTKLLAVLHGCLTQPGGCAVTQHDVDGINYRGRRDIGSPCLANPVVESAEVIVSWHVTCPCSS